MKSIIALRIEHKSKCIENTQKLYNITFSDKNYQNYFWQQP